MAKLIGPLTWAWVIIIGGLMFTPEGITCIACGPVATKVIAVISIVLGVIGFVVNKRK
ncbi:MAG: hypothetical protein LLF28_03100 [Nitrospiraceae bacterium]|nr:hypothetical protein [Nitrospiraceae bacterium]